MPEIDSLTISITASTASAGAAIDRLIGKLNQLKSAVKGASNFGKIAQAIKDIGEAADKVDANSGKKLTDLANGLNALAGVKSLSRLSNAGAIISDIAQAVNEIDGSAGARFEGVAKGIESLGNVNAAKLKKVRDALKQNRDFGTPIADSKAMDDMNADARPSAANQGAGAMRSYGAMTVFTYMADEIRSATQAIIQYSGAMRQSQVIETEFVESANQIAGAVKSIGAAVENVVMQIQGAVSAMHGFANALPGSQKLLQGGFAQEGPWKPDEIKDAANGFKDYSSSAVKAADVIETEFTDRFKDFKMSPLEDVTPNITLAPIEEATGAFGGFANVISTVTHGLGRLFSALSAIPKYFGGQLISNIKGSVKGLGQFLASVKRIAMYRAIRAALRAITKAFSDGMKNLYAWSSALNGQFAASMDRLATSTNYLGNSLGAMVSPLYNAIVPVIDAIIDHVVTLINMINQLFAALTGAKTYTAAKKTAASWGDAGKSAGGAANEIRKTILAFDELNTLQKASSGGGGGGGGGNSGVGEFETLSIESSISDFADKIREAWENQDWKTLGTTVGAKFNEIINSIDWPGLGSTIGTYINGWFTTKYWTLDTINFTNIGTNIADFLNNAIAQIDFGIIGRTLVQRMTIIGDLIIGFFAKFDWGQAAEKLSNFYQGMYDELSKWLQKYNWAQIGEMIVNKIVDFITHIDYAGLASSISEFLGSLLGAAIGLISGLGKKIGDKLAEAFTGIGEYFKEQVEACGGDIVLGILRGIILGLVNIGVWIVENIFQPFINGFKSAFGIASPAKEMIGPGEEIMNGVLQGILNVIGTIGQWVIDNVFEAIKKAFELSGEVVEILIGIGKNIIGAVLDGILSVMGGIVEFVADKVLKPLVEAFTKDDEEKDGENFSKKLWRSISEEWRGDDRHLEVDIVSISTAKTLWTDISLNWAKLPDRTLKLSAEFTSAADLYDAIKTEWDNFPNHTLYVSPKLDNTAKALFNSFKKEWNKVTGRTLYASPKLDNTAKTLYSNFKKEWERITSRTLYVSPKLDNTARTLYNNFKKEWDSSGSKSLYFSPKLDNTAKALYDAFKREWDNAGSKTLYFSPKLDNTASVLYNAFKAEWDKLSHTLYFSPKLDNTASVLYDSFIKAFEDMGSKTVYFSPKLDNTADVLWNGFKSAWDNLGSKTLYMSPKLDNTASALWNSFKREWDDMGSLNVKLNSTTTVVNGLWNNLVSIWNSVTSGKVLEVEIQAVKNVAENIWDNLKKKLSEFFAPGNTSGEWDGIDTSTNQYSQEWYDKNIAPLLNNPVQVPVVPTWSPYGGATGGGGQTSGGGAGRSKPTVAQWVEDNYGGGSVIKNVLLKHGWDGGSVLGWIFKYWWGGNVEKLVYLKNAFGGLTILGWLYKNWWGGNVEKPVFLKNGWGFSTILAWLQPKMGGDAQAPVSLAPKWDIAKPKPVLHLTDSDLSSNAKIGLTKNYSDNPLEQLGLTNLKAKVAIGLTIDDSNKSVVIKPNSTKTKYTVKRETKALGGAFFGGLWHSIPQYASGTLNAGSLFLAGEAGPEIVGHVGGRTEVLNKSQLASAMYSAVRAAMAPASANFAEAAQSMMSEERGIDANDFADMIQMAVESAMERSNDYDRQQVELLRQINEKEFSAEITTSGMAKAQTRMNRRAGTTIVPVGT